MPCHRQLFTILIVIAGVVRMVTAQATQPASSAPAAGPAMTEDQKIEALIQAVSLMTEAKFVRNGTEYDGSAAAAHMRLKWHAAKADIKTARDFIRLAASESSVSGKPYLIRFGDGHEMTSAEYLTGILRRVEAIQAIDNVRTGVIPATRPASHPATAPATHPDDANPAVSGFDAAGSDAKAIELADLTMQTMGGRKAWDQTRCITWQFLGRRWQVWDKKTGDIRTEVGEAGADSHTVILMNLNTHAGRVWKGDTEITDLVSRDEFLSNAAKVWVNDARSMFLPYQLKDAGFTLKYKGERKMDDGRDADVIEATIAPGSPAPGSTARCELFIARDNHLVGQWAYFEDAADARPRIEGPWVNWQRYGRIMLSDQRGPGRAHSDIVVFDELPESVFKDPKPVDWNALRSKATPPATGNAATTQP